MRSFFENIQVIFAVEKISVWSFFFKLQCKNNIFKKYPYTCACVFSVCTETKETMTTRIMCNNKGENGTKLCSVNSKEKALKCLHTDFTVRVMQFCCNHTIIAFVACCLVAGRVLELHHLTGV